MGEKAFFELLSLQRADNAAQSHLYDRVKHFDVVEKIANDILAEGACLSLKDLAVNGNDLINNGFTRGKILGNILEYLLKSVIEEKLENNKESLLKEAKERFGG